MRDLDARASDDAAGEFSVEGAALRWAFDGPTLFLSELTGEPAAFERLFAAVETHAQFVEVLVGLVHGGPARHRGAVLGFELHLAALRDPRLRVLTQRWTGESRAVLARFAGPHDADRLDALLEGMIMHALLATEPQTPEVTRAAITRSLDEASDSRP